LLDNNPRTVSIAAGGTSLYQRHNDGKIWRSTGTPCSGASCPGWQMLDNNGATVDIVAQENTKPNMEQMKAYTDRVTAA